MSDISGFGFDSVAGEFLSGSPSVMRVLEINVVKTFSPGQPLDILMKEGDVKSIDFGHDPDASCYEHAPTLPISITGTIGLTATPSAFSILDVTSSQKGTFSVSFHVQPKSSCIQNYPNPSI